MGSLALTAQPAKQDPFRPLPGDIVVVPFGDVAALEAAVDSDTAAVFLEPILGEGGVIPAPEGYLAAARAACDAHGALLVFDEVQTGFGRTGRLFAFQHTGVVPDILVLGKALGGGMPMGAFVSSATRMELLTHDPVLGHITTFGGHPIPCVAGLAALEAMLTEDMVANAVHMGALFKELLVHPRIVEVRGEGLMLAVDLGDADLVQRVVLGCLAEGVLGFWFLSCPTAFRIAPPLVITEEQVRHACAVILRMLDRG
jgi:acetylornithine/succinyldiaminopimelate/putrescine aminotransferase